MKPTSQQEQALRHRLPLDDDEQVIAVYRHHWFAYASSWTVAVLLVLIVVGLVAFLLHNPDVPSQYRQAISVGGALLSIIVFGAAILPAYLMSQETMVLTNEALFQLLQPSLLSSKVDQVSLPDVGNISVRQDMLGTIFGYGHISVETPGEQDNYEFRIVATPKLMAQRITEEKEDFDAGLQSGRIDSAWRGNQPAAPTIDPQEFQEFLEFQQMKKQQAALQDQQPQAQPQNQPPEPPQAPQQ